MTECLECHTMFSPTGREEICGEKCRTIRYRRQKDEQWARKKAQMPVKEDILCPYCMTMFTPMRRDTKVCSNSECQRKRNIDTVMHRKAGDAGVRVTKEKQTKKSYDNILPSKYKIANFTYSKLLKQCVKNVSTNHNKEASFGISKIVRAKATDLMQKKIKAMDPLAESTKLLLLERAYIIEFEKEKLRMNIKNTLDQEKTDGDYTLQEIGMVLGVSRERARQLEADAVKMMQRPGPARLLRNYLDFQISTEFKI